MASPPDTLVRKTVTVLFCDVTGSTSLGEQVDPETMRGVMLRYFDEMRAVLEHHGGTVEKFIGDAVVAVFGVPTLHEDDALRALRAADEMRTRLSKLNEELMQRWGVRLEMRIGVNTGEVVVGDPSTGQTVATGDSVNVAARLQQAAGPGEILLGRETYRLVRGQIRAGPLEAFTLKGKAHPVAPWRLEHVLATTHGTLRRLTTPLIGRDQELEFVQQIYERTVSEESCRLVTVFGAAGLGKTRLAEEVGAKLLGARVVSGRCLPYGHGITFWPIVDIIRQVAAIVDDDSPADVRRKVAALLPPGDSSLVSERIAGVMGLDAEIGQVEEVFWAVRKLFESLARSRPLVLVLEDIHWAEPTLLDLLEYLVGWSTGVPMMLLCLARPELVEIRTAWGSPGPNVDSLVLEPLAPSEVDSLLSNLIGNGDLDERVSVRIVDAAEGNPLFVEEMLRMLIDEGILVAQGGAWVAQELDKVVVPPTISAVLASRLDRLEPEERLLAQCASVIGKQFWWGAVAALAPPELRPDVARWLQSLVRKHLVVPDETAGLVGEDAFRFGHILIRDAAYTSLPKSLRSELHERFADWLEHKAGDRLPEYDEILGYHLEQAYATRLELGPEDARVRVLGIRAGTVLARGGMRALARTDITAARNLLERAGRLLPRHDRTRLELLCALGSALIRCGDFNAADAVLEEAATCGRAAGDRTLELRALIEQSHLALFMHATRAPDHVEAVVQLLPELEELGDDLNLANAWWVLSEVHVDACRWSARAEALELARAHATKAGDRQLESWLISHLAQALLYGSTPVDEAIERCEDLLAEAREDRALEAAMLSTLGPLYAMRGDFDEGRGASSRAAAIDDELGLRLRRAVRSLARAEVESLSGDPEAAERELRWGYETAEAIGAPGVVVTLGAFLADVLVGLGRLDEALELTRRVEREAGEDDIVTQVMWRCARARARALRGEVQTALELARETDRLAELTDFPNLQVTALLALARVLSDSGDYRGAGAVASRATEISERKGNRVAAARAATLVAGLVP